MQICPRSPVRSALLILGVLAALALAACGGGSSDEGDLGPDPASVTPAGVPVYIDAVVRPDEDTDADLKAALSTLLGQDDPIAPLRAQLDEAIGVEGLSYDADIAPWLAPRLGGFLLEFSETDADGAIAIGITDTDAANAFIDKVSEANDSPEEEATHAGVSYMKVEDGNAFGIVGDFLVTGTESGLTAAIDASTGDSLATNEAANDALDSVPEGSLFRAYVDPPGLIERLVDAGQLPQQNLDQLTDQLGAYGDGPVVLSGATTADSMSFEVSAPADPESGQTEIVSTLPGGSWLALGIPKLGQTIGVGYQQFLASLAGVPVDGIGGVDPLDGALPLDAAGFDIQAELERQLGLDLSKDLAWAGDAGLFIEGSAPLGLGVGVVIETDDEVAATRALGQLALALARQPGIRMSRTADGFQISPADGTPIGAEVAVRDGKFVIAGGAATIDDVLNPAQALADSEGFQAASSALGEELTAAVYLDVPTMLTLLQAVGVDQDPDFQDAQQYLEAISFVTAGSGIVDNRSIGRLVLGLQEAGSSSATTAAIVP